MLFHTVRSIQFARFALMISASLILGACQSMGESRPKPVSAEPPPAQPENKSTGSEKMVGDIITQPARDVGLSETATPKVLEKAAQAPYDLQGIRTCKQLAASIQELTDVLGPDFDIAIEKKENRAGKLAEAGGKTVVNSLIPFRGLVREITGAAPAQRRLAAAIDAGFARRGYLRGVYRGRKCRPMF